MSDKKIRIITVGVDGKATKKDEAPGNKHRLSDRMSMAEIQALLTKKRDEVAPKVLDEDENSD